jgi:fucose permease
MNKDYYINLAQVFLCIGAVFGPVLAVVMMTIGNSFRVNYFILAILIFILFFVTMNLKIDEKPTSERINLKDIKIILWNKNFLRICICIALYSGTELGVWGWMSTFMEKEMELSQRQSIIFVSVFWISLTIGRIICGKLMKYFDVRNIIIVLALLSSLAVLFSGFLEGGVIVVLSVIAIGLSFSSIFPFLLSIGSSIFPSSSAFAVMVGSSGIGIVFIPFFMGLIGENVGMRIAMMSPCLLLLVIALLLTLEKKKKTECVEEYIK